MEKKARTKMEKVRCSAGVQGPSKCRFHIWSRLPSFAWFSLLCFATMNVLHEVYQTVVLLNVRLTVRIRYVVTNQMNSTLWRAKSKSRFTHSNSVTISHIVIKECITNCWLCLLVVVVANLLTHMHNRRKSISTSNSWTNSNLLTANLIPFPYTAQ